MSIPFKMKEGVMNTRLMTPLMRAAYTGDVTTLRRLIASGPQDDTPEMGDFLTKRDAQGCTAYDYAKWAQQHLSGEPKTKAGTIVGILERRPEKNTEGFTVLQCTLPAAEPVAPASILESAAPEAAPEQSGSRRSLLDDVLDDRDEPELNTLSPVVRRLEFLLMSDVVGGRELLESALQSLDLESQQNIVEASQNEKCRLHTYVWEALRGAVDREALIVALNRLHEEPNAAEILNYKLENGDSLLHFAARQNCTPDILALLLVAGADIDAINERDNNSTPIDCVDEEQKATVAELFASEQARRRGPPLEPTAAAAAPRTIAQMLGAGAVLATKSVGMVVLSFFAYPLGAAAKLIFDSNAVLDFMNNTFQSIGNQWSTIEQQPAVISASSDRAALQPVDPPPAQHAEVVITVTEDELDLVRESSDNNQFLQAQVDQTGDAHLTEMDRPKIAESKM